MGGCFWDEVAPAANEIGSRVGAEVGGDGSPTGVWVYADDRRYAISTNAHGELRFAEHDVDGVLLTGPLLPSSDLPPPTGFAAQWAVPLHSAEGSVGVVWLRLRPWGVMQTLY